MPILCRLGFHRWNRKAKLVAVEPKIFEIIAYCERCERIEKKTVSNGLALSNFRVIER